MRTAFYWGLILTVLTGAAAWAQDSPAPIAASTATPTDELQPVTTQGEALTWAQGPGEGTPTSEYSLTQDSLPRSNFPFYICLAAGPALTGFNFGSAGNPWLGAGGATWAQGYGRHYYAGPFVQLKFGKYLNPNLAAELDLNYGYFPLPQTYPGIPNSNYYSDEINVIPTLRYDLLASLDTPYVLVGAGMNINRSSSPTGTATQEQDDNDDGTYTVSNNTSLSRTNPVVTGGVGFLFNLLGGNFYVQAQCDYVFTGNGGFAYYPLVLGFLGGEMRR